jgi:ABC-type sugar transport system permease subunit
MTYPRASGVVPIVAVSAHVESSPVVPTAGAPSRGRPGWRSPSLSARRRRTALVFTIPVVAVVAALLCVPIGQAVYYSFTNWNGLTAQWLGPSAYSQLFHNPEFTQVLINNGTLLASVPIAMILSLAVAVLISGRIRGWRFFRTVFFLPTAISWVVIGYVGLQFFSDNGILQSLLNHVGLGFLHPQLLSHESRAIFAIMITYIWSMFGVNLIVFLAGMATVDQEIYDAAKIDGAGPISSLIHITLPLLKRFVQFSFVISLVTAFSALFSLIFVMTGGGPGFSTTTLEFFVYQQAFTNSNFGQAATAGIVLFGAIFIISMIVLRLLRSND